MLLVALCGFVWVDMVGGMMIVIECADSDEVAKQVDDLATAINPAPSEP